MNAGIRVFVEADARGERWDRALVLVLAQAGISCTRSQLARAFATGDVRAEDGRVLRPGRLVEGPAWVAVALPDSPLRTAAPEAIPLVVLHEDADVLVVDKPAGMVVHASPGHDVGTLVGAVLHHLGVGPEALPVLPGNDATRPGIVHRLDKDTSGVLVVAKTGFAQARLAEQFQAHRIDRHYVGFVYGRPTWTTRRLETLHGRDPHDRRRFSPDVPRGRKAITHATVLGVGPQASRVRFELETGRTHQIRMHARALGLPIFGDRLYAKTPREPTLGALWEGLPRHALHAARLGFEHPRGGWVSFDAELPEELVALAHALELP